MYVAQSGSRPKLINGALGLLALIFMGAACPNSACAGQMSASEAGLLTDKGIGTVFPWADARPVADADPTDPVEAKNVRMATDTFGAWVAAYHTGRPNDDGTTPSEFSHLMVTYSYNDGGSWEEPFDIPDVPEQETNYTFRPDLATDTFGNYVMLFEALTFNGPKLYKTLSDDEGQTWDVPTPMGDFPDNNNPRNVSIGSDIFGTYMAAWIADADGSGPQGVNIAYSEDGIVWTLKQRVNNTGSGRPQVKSGGGAVDSEVSWVITFEQMVGGDMESRAAITPDDGDSWVIGTINTDELSDDGKNDFVARLDYSFTNDAWVAIWGSSSSGVFNVYTARAVQGQPNGTDGGFAWSAPTLVGSDIPFGTEPLVDPWIATDAEGHWLALWSQQLQSGPQNPPRDLFFIRSDDDGLNFDTPTSIDVDFQTSQPRWHHPVLGSSYNGRWLGMWQNFISPNQDENSPQTAVPWYSTTFIPLDGNYLDVEIKATDVNGGLPLFAGTTPAADFTITYQVSNFGPQTAFDTAVHIEPDAGIQILAFQDTGTGQIIDNGGYPSPTADFVIPMLAPGESETFQLTMRSSVSGQQRVIADAIPFDDIGQEALDADQSNNINVITRLDFGEPQVIADLRITKTANMNPAVIGEYLGYTIEVRNMSSEAASDVVIRDPLPAGLLYNLAAVSHGDVDAVVDPTNPSGNLTVVATFSSIAGGARETLVIATTPQVGAPSLVTNGACVEHSGIDPNATNDCAQVAVGVVGGTGSGSDLAIVKTSNLDSVVRGTSFTYTLRVTNGGPSNANNVVITDNLPASLTFIGEYHTQGTLSRTGNAVTVNVGTLNAGSSAAVNLSVIPTVVGNVTNVASVGPTATDPSTGNNTSSKQVTVTAANPSSEANISVSKSANPSPGNVGSPLTYTVQVSNAGPSVASNVVLQDLLPPEVAFVSSAPTETSYANGIVSYLIPSLGVGSNQTFQISTTAIAGGVAINTASVSSDNPDFTPSNNIATISTQINGGGGLPTNADLALSSAVLPASASVGNAITWTLTARNNGPQSAASILVNTTLPSTVTFVSATGPSGSATPIGNSLVVPIPVLGPGASTNVSIVLVPQAGGNLTLTASISGNVNDSVAGNNTASSTVPVSGTGAFDLAGTWLKLSKKAHLGLVPSWKVKGSFRVQNLRTTLLVAAPVHFYLSNDTTFDSSDILLGSQLYKKLKPGKAKKKTIKATLTFDPAGKYLIAVINPTGGSNENTVPILLP